MNHRFSTAVLSRISSCCDRWTSVLRGRRCGDETTVSTAWLRRLEWSPKWIAWRRWRREKSIGSRLNNGQNQKSTDYFHFGSLAEIQTRSELFSKLLARSARQLAYILPSRGVMMLFEYDVCTNGIREHLCFAACLLYYCADNQKSWWWCTCVDLFEHSHVYTQKSSFVIAKIIGSYLKIIFSLTIHMCVQKMTQIIQKVVTELLKQFT